MFYLFKIRIQHAALPQTVIQKLDALLLVRDSSVSALEQLKDPPGKVATTAMNRLTDKLARISSTGVLEVDLSWLNNNYQRSLASYVRTCSAHRLREVEPPHRYGAMVCFLWQTYADTVDFIIDMHAKLMNKVEKQAKSAFDVELLQRRVSINESLSMFITVGGVVLDGAVKNSKRFGPFDRFFISKVKWESMREEFLGQSGLPLSGKKAARYLTDRLNGAYDRFAFRRKVLQQNYSDKFNDYALEFYSFVADNYAPFYSVPIECNERDAPYVLDGLLYTYISCNESRYWVCSN